jgi:hypothetical protein
MKNCSTLLRAEYLYKDRFSVQEICLFNHLFASIWNDRYLFYASGYSMILYFVCSNFPALTIEKFFQLATVYLWHTPSLKVWGTSLLFLHFKIVQTYLVCFLLQFQNQPLRSHGSFYLKMWFETKIWAPSCSLLLGQHCF